MPSDRDRWIERGRPIENGRDLVFALAEVQLRAEVGSRWWYLLNKFQCEAMAAADEESFKRRAPPSDRLAKPYGTLPIRTCRSLHHCCICGNDITLGQRYHDGGYGRRGHVACAELWDTTVSKARRGEVTTEEDGV